jgi:hypothetical protein
VTEALDKFTKSTPFGKFEVPICQVERNLKITSIASAGIELSECLDVDFDFILQNGTTVIQELN